MIFCALKDAARILGRKISSRIRCMLQGTVALCILACAMSASGQAGGPGRRAGAGTPAAAGSPLAGWSVPERLALMPRGLSLRWPSVVVREGAVLLAGNVVPVEAGAPMPTRPLILLGGGITEPPSGDFSFAYPKAVLDSSGAYHLFWAEPDHRSNTDGRWPGTTLTGLWHAVRRGGRWSVPERLLAEKNILWGAEPGSVVVDGRGRIQLVVPAIPPSGYLPELRLLRWSAGSWHAQTLSDATPSYASVGALADDSLLAAYTGPDRAVRADGNSVFVIWSTDGGASWGRPQLVSRSGSTPATRPLVVTGGGHAALIWVQARSGAAPVLRLRSSRDGGTHWENEEDAPVSGNVLGLVAFPDSCGDVSAVLSTLDAGGPRLTQARWEGGLPGLTPLFVDESAAVFPSVALAGSAHLVWAAVVSDGAAVAAMHSERSLACKREPSPARSASTPPPPS